MKTMKTRILDVLITLSILAVTLMSATYTSSAYAHNDNKIDVILFIGQSNMVGQGDVEKVPELKNDCAMAYNYVTNPTELVALEEPFGYGQDSDALVNGPWCTGSMVTSFCNKYCSLTGRKVVAIPASAVGTGSSRWSTTLCKDANKRLEACLDVLEANNYELGNVHVVWMHGENDVCALTETNDYVERVSAMFDYFVNETAVEDCYLIETGKIVTDVVTGELRDTTAIHEAQEILGNNENCTIISTKAYSLGVKAYKEDGIHLTQKSLNTIGTEAGTNAAIASLQLY